MSTGTSGAALRARVRPRAPRDPRRDPPLRVLGPAPGGGTRVAMSGRRLLSSMGRLPDRTSAIVAAAEGLGRLQGRVLPVAVVADPALARAILTRPTGIRRGRGIDALKFTLGDGLLTSEGELHRRQRRLVQPSFHARRLRGYALDAVALAAERSASWQDGRQVDVAEEMSSLTLEVVGRTLFGADVRDDARVVAAAQAELLAMFPQLMTLRGQLAMRFPTHLARRARRCIAQLDGVVERVIAERQPATGTGGGDPGGTRDAQDVVSMLLAARDEDTGEAMPHGLVRDEVMTLLLAGHETTAVALSWAWWELARDPRARAALDGELAGPAGRQALAEASWNELPFTRAVVAESMRLHPPAYMLGRRPAETLEIEGYRVRKGSVLLISTYALHRDPRWWGEDAAAFRPGRWLDADGRFDEGNPGQPRGAYLPFGAGSRMCIGSGFAVMEAVLLLARLATDWRIEVDPGVAVRMQPLVTLRPRAIPATLRRAAPTG